MKASGSTSGGSATGVPTRDPTSSQHWASTIHTQIQAVAEEPQTSGHKVPGPNKDNLDVRKLLDWMAANSDSAIVIGVMVA